MAKTKAKICVIVPVYNVEKYIKNCLESLIHQTMKEIEIVCVNDGSTDDSAKVIEKYTKKDDRIKLINQENQGVAAARNTGLKAAKNIKYLMFCDPDDEFDVMMCEKMYKAIEKSEADMACCGMAVEYEVHDEKERDDNAYYRLKFRGKVYIDDNIMRKTDTSLCDKIFRNSIVQEYKISFPDGLKNEDYYFYMAYASVSNTAFYLNQRLYKYVRREGSIMSEDFDQNSYSPDHLLVAIKLFEFYSKNNFVKQHTDLFWTQFVESYWFSYTHSAKKFRKKIHDIAVKFIDKYYAKNEPTIPKVRTQVIMIKRNNIYYRVLRRGKGLITRPYLKLNLAYRQQEHINKQIDDLEAKLSDLESRIDNLLENK